jgi:uncharacterized protein (UPF0305 family)
MNKKIKKLSDNDKISKSLLLKILREDAKKIGLNEIIASSIYLQGDAKYVPANYRKEYLKSYVKGFLTRIKDVKEDSRSYRGMIDLDEFVKAVDLLYKQEYVIRDNEYSEPSFFKIYEIISLYTTFILNEPIHQVGTLFPGGFKVKYKDGSFFCPVKKNNEDNPLAVCPFCIAEQDPEN